MLRRAHDHRSVRAHPPAVRRDPRNGVRAAFTLGDPNLAANYFICSLLVLRAARYPACPQMALLCGDRDRHHPDRLQRRRAGAGRHYRTRRPVHRRRPAPGCRSGRHHRRRTRPRRAGHRPPCARSGHLAQAQASRHFSRTRSAARRKAAALARTPSCRSPSSCTSPATPPSASGRAGPKSAFQAHQYGYVKMAHDDYSAALLERGVLGGRPHPPPRHHRHPLPPDCHPTLAAGLRRHLPAPGTAGRRCDRHVHLRHALPGAAFPAPVGAARNHRRRGPVGPSGP